MERTLGSKPVRIVAAALIVVGCFAAVLICAGSVTLTYELPPVGNGGRNIHTTVFGPAVAATAVAGGLTALAGIWLIWNVVRKPPARLWIAPAILLVAAIVTVVAVSGAARPVF